MLENPSAYEPNKSGVRPAPWQHAALDLAAVTVCASATYMGNLVWNWFPKEQLRVVLATKGAASIAFTQISKQIYPSSIELDRSSGEVEAKGGSAALGWVRTFTLCSMPMWVPGLLGQKNMRFAHAIAQIVQHGIWGGLTTVCIFFLMRVGCRRGWIDKEEFSQPSAYDVLGVAPDASDREITAAYREQSLKNHSDKGGDEEEFKRIGEIYETLRDPIQRRTYDLVRISRGLSPPELLQAKFAADYAHGDYFVALLRGAVLAETPNRIAGIMRELSGLHVAKARDCANCADERTKQLLDKAPPSSHSVRRSMEQFIHTIPPLRLPNSAKMAPGSAEFEAIQEMLSRVEERWKDAIRSKATSLPNSDGGEEGATLEAYNQIIQLTVELAEEEYQSAFGSSETAVLQPDESVPTTYAAIAVLESLVGLINQQFEQEFELLSAVAQEASQRGEIIKAVERVRAEAQAIVDKARLQDPAAGKCVREAMVEYAKEVSPDWEELIERDAVMVPSTSGTRKNADVEAGYRIIDLAYRMAQEAKSALEAQKWQERARDAEWMLGEQKEPASALPPPAAAASTSDSEGDLSMLEEINESIKEWEPMGLD